jgi:hypothetical protein
MPSIVFVQHGVPTGGRLTGRVLIGRRLSHGVTSDDPAVSRLHGWIDPDPETPGRWVVTDAGSKAGIQIDGEPVTRHRLEPGNVITAGALQIRFEDSDKLDPSVRVIELTPPAGKVQTTGVLFDCVCGAPIWAGDNLAGKRGLCRHCRRPVVVPQPAPAIVRKTPFAPAVKSAESRLPRCGVCHADIQPGEISTACPDCDIKFHAECWEENRGCSTYGCPQVGALLNQAGDFPAPAPAEADSPIGPDAGSELTRASMLPLAMVMASLLASLLGALAFGIPALLAAAVSGVIWVRQRKMLLVIAVMIGLAGCLAGLGVSDWWYLGGRHLEQLKRWHKP